MLQGATVAKRYFLWEPLCIKQVKNWPAQHSNQMQQMAKITSWVLCGMAMENAELQGARKNNGNSSQAFFIDETLT